MKYFASFCIPFLLLLGACGPHSQGGPELRNATPQELTQRQIADDQADLAAILELRSSLAEARSSMDEEAMDEIEAGLKNYLRSELDESKHEIKLVEENDGDPGERKAQRDETYRIAKELRSLSGKRDGESLEKASELMDELVVLARMEIGEEVGELKEDRSVFRAGRGMQPGP